MFESKEVENIVSFKRVSAIDNVSHVREGYGKDYIYMYIAFFIQLHVWLLFNKLTMVFFIF